MNSIEILNNPGASIIPASSADGSHSQQQSPSWSSVELPRQIITSRARSAFVQLNSHEIAILGGVRKHGKQSSFGDVVIFDTTSFHFKKALEDDENFRFIVRSNQSANVSDDTIVALVQNYPKLHMIRYRNGAQKLE